MTRQPKTTRFNDFNVAINCFGDRQLHANSWAEYLGQKGNLTLELGCGTALLSLELARRHPKRRFLAVDRKSDRMQQAATRAAGEKLPNIAFLQADIADLLTYIRPGLAADLWLAFPHPYPKRKHLKHRISGGRYLDIYAQLLKVGGRLHIKTDNADLAAWTLQQLTAHPCFEVEFMTEDLLTEHDDSETLIATAYQTKFTTAGLPTHYLRARLIQRGERTAHEAIRPDRRRS